MLAAERGRVAVADYLIQNGAYKDLQNEVSHVTPTS